MSLHRDPRAAVQSQPEIEIEIETQTPAEFCAALWDPLVGTLTIKLDNTEVAKELAQEALARARQHWPELQRMDAPDRWVFRVALNLASSWVRRRAAERRAHNRLGDAVKRQLQHEETTDVRQAVRALPKREREVITLRYYGGLSVRDVAELLGISEGAVKSASFDARARLRNALDPETSKEAHD